MIIPVKTIEIIKVDKEVEVIKYVPVVDYIDSTKSIFQKMIDYLLTLEFLESSTNFTEFKSFVSYKQGGNNIIDLHSIEILYEQINKVTIKVTWKTTKTKVDTAVIIFKKPIQE